MEMSYIFGSFARRRQSRQTNSPKRKSAESPKIIHERSNSAPHVPKKTPTTQPRAKSICDFITDDTNFKCPKCRRLFFEPKVLPCLHTFCLSCLTELEVYDWSEEEFRGTTLLFPGSSSGGSGYSSDKNKTPPTTERLRPRKFIRCPTCENKAELPQEGVASYPPNYLIQHKMVLAALNAGDIKLLCDVCVGEVRAISRCSECALNFCTHCQEAHLWQKTACHHQVLPLDEARRRGITSVRRQIMCLIHPEMEVEMFCETCLKILCKTCIPLSHPGHPVRPVALAAQTHLPTLRAAAARLRAAADRSIAAAMRLDATARKADTDAARARARITEFMEGYAEAVRAHRDRLLGAATRAGTERRREAERRGAELRRRGRGAGEAAAFVEGLLGGGVGDAERMCFVGAALERAEGEELVEEEGKEDEGVVFLEGELGMEGRWPVYGVVSCRTVAAGECVVVKGEGTRPLRIAQKCEFILETKDRSGIKLDRGGEPVTAELRYRDSGVSKMLPVTVEDHKNGIYTISFVPDLPGKLVLNVMVRGQPVKGNPLPLTVRALKPHHGSFHCCSFCSSGGSKEASCGCGGRMPGGYKGCGHGHEGHPGRRHWSCCGSILEHSECGKGHYQFTL